MKKHLWFAIYGSPAIVGGIVVGLLTSSIIGYAVGFMAMIVILQTPLCNRWIDYTIKKAGGESCEKTDFISSS